MDKNIRDTRALLDSDNSSDSIVEVVSGVEGTVTIAVPSNEAGIDGTNNVTANTSNISNSKEDCPNSKNVDDNDAKKEYDEASDIPSLVDASDAEDTQSNTSESITSSPLFEETTKEDEFQGGNENDVKEPKPSDEVDYEKEEEEDDDEGEEIQTKDDIEGLGVTTGEPATSVNTIRTSNQGTKFDSISLQEQQQEQDVENDQTQKEQDHEGSVALVACKYQYSNIFEKYIAYVTEFLTCSSPTLCTSSNSCFHGISSTSPIQTQTDGGSDSDTDQQLQILQTCIEIDILNLMGCSAEGAQHLIDSLGQSLFCNQCQCSTQVDNKKNGILGTCKQCDRSNMGTSENRPKIRNRNVYVRQKALHRIRRLRQGGLSRHFSLAPVSTFLEEEMSSIDVNQTKVDVDNAQKQRKARRGSLIPLSKRPKSLSDDTRQTSFGANATALYESTVFATRSDDYISMDDDEEEDDTNMSNKRLSQQQQQQQQQQQHNKNMSSVFGSILDNQIFNGIFPKSCLRQTSQNNDARVIPDLYYDSDPGIHYNHPSIDQSELRKAVFSKKSTRRSKTVGVIDNVASDLQRLEMDMLVGKKGLIASLDILSFDVNDSNAISSLMKELITSNFSFIWHPNNTVKDGSVLAGESTRNATPHRIKAWFEMGSCLKKALIQPKFVWRRNDSVTFVSRQSKMKSIQKPEYVELLNIVRIITPTKVDRNIHPFVKLDCSFIIVTNNDEEALFETATKDERDKFLFAFKLMVARLASKIIVGDKDVFDEFFTPLGMSRRTRKKRRKRQLRSKKSNDSSITSSSSSSMMTMRGIKEEDDGDGGSDRFSVTSEMSGFSKSIIGTVEEEGNRRDELWGGMM